MDKIAASIQEYIKSGEYFVDARKWYNNKYLAIIPHHAVLMPLCLIVLTMVCYLAMHINALLPLKQEVRYAVASNATTQTAVQIFSADQVPNDPLASIADIMVKNYVTHREEYDYDRLKTQFNFIRNNSTRVIFRKFFTFMNIDNPDSPIMRYQKMSRRTVKILSTNHIDLNEVVVKFESIAKMLGSELSEHQIWEAVVNFEIDKIDNRTRLPSGSRFNFAVTNYTTKLIEDKLKK